MTLIEELEMLDLCPSIKNRLINKCKIYNNEIERLNQIISNCNSRIGRLEDSIIELSLLLGSSIRENR